jgi:UDP-N-acetylmuramate--alanine ligase
VKFSGREKIHLIGIGGIGMSGIAQLLLNLGNRVSGSDVKPSSLIEKLRHLGAEISIGHQRDNLADADIVIVTPAVKSDNPELVAAQERNLKILTRAQALAELANQKNTIAVTGAHGKTTTSSLTSHILSACGLKPTICVGGEVFSLNGNAFTGSGNYFVLEADESDGSLLTLNPLYSIITNVDREHMDYYRNLEHVMQTFKEFLTHTKKEGVIFLCRDDKQLMRLARSAGRRIVTFGLGVDADIYAKDIVLKESFSEFTCMRGNEEIAQFTVPLPGRHNVSNALAAIALSLELEIDIDSLKKSFESFRGIRRRMELKLKKKDILVFEDYAHHPTEIKATLDALKNFKHKRIFAVFQPHRYTRTKFLLNEFGTCFRGVDRLIVTDIYAASEPPIEGINAEVICEKAKKAGVENATFLPKYDILKSLLQELKPGDLVAVMGAGDIGSLAGVLAEEIKKSLTVERTS